jgi:hypothetical protein
MAKHLAVAVAAFVAFTAILAPREAASEGNLVLYCAVQ